MRRLSALAVAAAIVVVVAVVAVLGRPAAAEPPKPKPTPVHVAYDAAHLDLDKRVLQFKPSRPIAEASIVAIGEDGTQLGSGAATYDHPPTDAWWSVTWTQPAETRVMMLKLRVAAADGVVTNVELIPWSVTVEHEDVTFRTNSAVIDPDERAKLDASLTKIDEIAQRASKFMKLELYIAGHTDTVGAAAANRTLSLARARAIGDYFRSKQLAISIAVAGFGEAVPKVKTPDETDEPANRRVDYVLGPDGGAPPFAGAYTKVKADWKKLR